MTSCDHDMIYSYEIACDNYLKCLNALHSLDDSGEVSNSAFNAPIIKFIVNQVFRFLFYHTVVWEKFNGGNFHVKKFRVKIFSS